MSRSENNYIQDGYRQCISIALRRVNSTTTVIRTMEIYGWIYRWNNWKNLANLSFRNDRPSRTYSVLTIEGRTMVYSKIVLVEFHNKTIWYETRTYQRNIRISIGVDSSLAARSVFAVLATSDFIYLFLTHNIALILPPHIPGRSSDSKST